MGVSTPKYFTNKHADTPDIIHDYNLCEQFLSLCY